MGNLCIQSLKTREHEMQVKEGKGPAAQSIHSFDSKLCSTLLTQFSFEAQSSAKNKCDHHIILCQIK